MIIINNLVREYRKDRKMTQRQLAKQVGIVYLNKNMTQTIASGALGGLGSLIANYVSGGAATFAVELLLQPLQPLLEIASG